MNADVKKYEVYMSAEIRSPDGCSSLHYIGLISGEDAIRNFVIVNIKDYRP